MIGQQITQVACLHPQVALETGFALIWVLLFYNSQSLCANNIYTTSFRIAFNWTIVGVATEAHLALMFSKAMYQLVDNSHLLQR